MTQRVPQSLGTIGSRFAAVFLMLAVLLQASAVQTHNHFASNVVAASDQFVPSADLSATTATPTIASGKSRPTTPPVCPLCEERALFGSYVLAAPVLIMAPVTVAAWYTSTQLLTAARRQVSHAWRSRAPPIA